MRNKSLTVFVALFCFLLVFSCKKKNNATPQLVNILSANAKVVDTNNITMVTDSTATFSKAANINVGQIVISAPTVSNPYGMLRKIVSIKDNGSTVSCVTEQSSLNEAFQQLNFDTTIIVTHNDSAALRTTSDGISLAMSFNNNNTIASGIKLNGIVKVNIPSVNLQYSKKDGSVTPEKIVIAANINTTGSSMEITNTSNSAVTIAAEEILYTFDNIPPLTITIPITTPVGIIPVPMRFSQKVILKALPITVSGKAKWTILPLISGTLGCQYESGSWSNLSTYSIDATSMPLSKGDFTPTLSLTASYTLFTPRYEIAPLALDNLKGFFEAPNSIEFTLQTDTPNYILNYKLDVTGGIETKFWDGVANTYSMTGNAIDMNLLKGNWDSDSTFLTAIVDGVPYTQCGTVYYNPGSGTQGWFMPDIMTCASPFSVAFELAYHLPGVGTYALDTSVVGGFENEGYICNSVGTVTSGYGIGSVTFTRYDVSSYIEGTFYFTTPSHTVTSGSFKAKHY